MSISLYGSIAGVMPALAADDAAAEAGPVSSAAADDSAPLQEVEVIGSKIRQLPTEVVSPVIEISSAEVRSQGASSIESLLNQYPQILSNETPFGGFSGIAAVDLRGLGPTRTLVLIDGRRVMPGDPQTPVADLDTIPVGLIDSVEVLTGGASAIYGSDALAGVVNFKLKRDFEGLRIDALYGFHQHHNDNSDARQALAASGFAAPDSNVTTGGTRMVTLQFGLNGADGHSNITGYASYREQRGVKYNQYDRSACALRGDAAPHSCVGSSNYNTFDVLNTPPAGTDPVRQFFALPDRTLKPYDSATDTYNFAPGNYLERPDKRLQLGGFAHKQLNALVDLYAEAMFTQDRTTQQQAPSAIFLGTGPVNGGFLLPCNDPMLSADQVQKLCTNFGLGPTDQVNLLVGRRNIEGGPRVYDLTHTAQRYVAGFKGAFDNGWTYDVSAQYGVTNFQARDLNELSKSRTLSALDLVVVNGVAKCRVTVAGLDPNCVPLDLLGGLGSWTPAMLSYIAADEEQTGSTVERIYSASASGDLGRFGIKSPWASRPVSVAVGAEHRSEQLEYLPGSTDLSGDIFGGAKMYPEPMNGFTVKELYGEVSAPLVEDAFLVRSLRLEAGVRGSDYSTSGRVSSSKLAFNWAPIEDLHVRGGLQHAVRAPNVLELYAPQLISTFGGVDPCAGANPKASPDTCAHMGVTQTEYRHIVECPTDACGAITGGNPQLTPEKSLTKTLGLTWAPSLVPGLAASVDVFDVTIKNTIGTIGAGVTLTQCTQTLNPFFCNLIHRDANGSLFANGAGIVDTNLNTGTLRTRGLDTQVRYRTTIGSAGTLGFNLVGTYVKESSTEPLPGLGSYDCAGLYGYTCGTPRPTWRHTLRSTWELPHGGVELSLAWRYFSSVGFDGNTTQTLLAQQTTIAPIKAQSFFDLSGSAKLTDNLSVVVGVDNLLDKDPPVLSYTYVNAAANTYPQVYDAMGRTIFISLSANL